MKYLLTILCFFLLTTVNAQETMYRTRLESLHAKVPLPYNSLVDEQIRLYLQNPAYTREILSRGSCYLKNIETVLSQHKLPAELKLLPVAVSGLDQTVVSEDGGSGFWQLKYHVAKSYDVYISSYVDERRDYLEGTRAAALYLTELHHMYNNWLLAIAAFCADPIELNKAIRLAGGSMDYWAIHPHLPQSCQPVVPRFIALNYIFNFYKEHQLQPVACTLPLTDTVSVMRFTTFQQLGRALQMDADSLFFLNPIFKKKTIPVSGNPYLIMLPPDKAALFRALGDTVYTWGQQVIPVDTTSAADTIEKEKIDIPPPPKPEPKGDVFVYHTVKSGEFLGVIADLYDCNVSEIKRWNNMRSDRVNAGQKIKIQVPAARQTYYRKINKMSSSEKKRIANQD